HGDRPLFEACLRWLTRAECGDAAAIMAGALAAAFAAHGQWLPAACAPGGRPMAPLRATPLAGPGSRRGDDDAPCRLQEAPQRVLQDAAVAEVFDLVERVDAAMHRLLAHAAAFVVDAQGEHHARLEAGLDANHIERLGTGQLQALAAHPVAELQRQ